MKLILDFFPILLFFISYKLSDIYTATAVLMAATTVQMALIYMRERSLQTMHKVTLVLDYLVTARFTTSPSAWASASGIAEVQPLMTARAPQ